MSGGADHQRTGVDLERVRGLIREHRRVILEARTISVTLASAVRDSEAADADVTPERRVELRADWSERAEALMLDVRVHAARSNRVADQVTVALRGSDMADALALLQQTITQAAQAIDAASASIATTRDAKLS